MAGEVEVDKSVNDMCHSVNEGLTPKFKGAKKKLKVLNKMILIISNACD